MLPVKLATKSATSASHQLPRIRAIGRATSQSPLPTNFSFDKVESKKYGPAKINAESAKSLANNRGEKVDATSKVEPTPRRIMYIIAQALRIVKRKVGSFCHLAS